MSGQDSTQSRSPFRRRLRRAADWLGRLAISRAFAVSLTVAAVAAGIATYAALTGLPPLGPDPNILLLLIVVDLVLLLPLAVLVAYRIVRIWVDRRKGSAGSRLHARLVLLFSGIAVIPAIIVAVFSALYFNFGIQAWHSERLGNALRESLNFTDHVLASHQDSLRSDIALLVSDIDRRAVQFMTDPRGIAAYVLNRADAHGFTGVAVFDARGRMLVERTMGVGLTTELTEDIAAAVRVADTGEVVMLPSRNTGHARAVVRLSIFYDSYLYLYVSRPIDPTILAYAGTMRDAINEFQRLRAQESSLQISFYVLFGLVALLLLLAAIWLGLVMANHLARPISRLIEASERIREGDLRARVSEMERNDELAALARSFNRMAGNLERNRRELVEANRQLDARREFTEAVLSGVSAGVIGLDEAGNVNLPNPSASELLETDLNARTGEPFAAVVPEMKAMLEAVRLSPGRPQQGEINLIRGGRARRFLVRMVAEQVGGETIGYVVTFDDVTELVSAQRKAAWADVARRIAHEIKNPLTPIQLSAERLRRKYLKQVSEDAEAFEACTDTIIRQVGDIGRLVDEFSAFARMPAPVLEPANVAELCSQTVGLQRDAHPKIRFTLDMPAEPVVLRCDARQIRQALTNLLQNALDSLTENGTAGGDPEIRMSLNVETDAVNLDVRDNGPGFPEEEMERLTEPYVTTRPKGTGLGLAIVRKIMEDHGGRLDLQNVEGGARARLRFARESLMSVADLASAAAE